jgi:transcriptional regulator with XRE-family HTH domain
MPTSRRPRWGPNALRRLRFALSFDQRRPATQREVARAIGVGLDRYYKLENGHEPPTPRELHALAALFQVSPRTLGIKARESRRVVVRTDAGRREEQSV